jgi:hypothetical protein
LPRVRSLLIGKGPASSASSAFAGDHGSQTAEGKSHASADVTECPWLIIPADEPAEVKGESALTKAGYSQGPRT